MPLLQPSHYFVIDTSSLIAIREVIPTSERSKVISGIDRLFANGQLVFPNEVLEELAPHARSPDPILECVKKHKDIATRFGTPWDQVGEVMRHPVASLVVDPEKTGGPDEADPYVLALALALRKKADVVVVTQEIRDRPGHVSMTSACGALRLIRQPLSVFLIDQGIWAG